MQIWIHQSMNQPCKDKAGDTLHDFSVQRKHFLTHGLKKTCNKSINGATPGLKNPGIGTNYSMAAIYIKKFRLGNQAGTAAYKAATNTTDNW